jgi:hypothetical protein
MNAPVENSVTTREEWWKVFSDFAVAEQEPHYRRRSRRYPCEGEIKVEGEVDDEPFKQIWKILQVSEGGLMARSPREVPLETRVTVFWRRNERNLMMSGRVIHCTQTIGGYKVGIRLAFPGD